MGGDKKKKGDKHKGDKHKGEKKHHEKHVITISARGEGLTAMDLNGLSDPYLVFKVPEKKYLDKDIPDPYKGRLIKKFTKFGLKGSEGAAERALSGDGLEISTEDVVNGVVAGVSAVFKQATKTHTETHGFKEIHQTPVVQKDLNPNWSTFHIHLKEKHHHHPTAKLLIECWDHDLVGSSDFMGYIQIPFAQIKTLSGENRFALSSRGGKARGFLILTGSNPHPAPYVDGASVHAPYYSPSPYPPHDPHSVQSPSSQHRDAPPHDNNGYQQGGGGVVVNLHK